MSKVLYIGWFGLPETAAGIRVYKIGMILRKMGHEVSYLCLGQHEKENCEKIYDGFKYFFVAQKKIRIFNAVNHLAGYFDLKYIKSYIKNYKPGIIILYNEKEGLTSHLIKYCKKRNIQVGADVTEWYEVDRTDKWNYIASKWVDYRIRKMDRNLDFIISISPFLKEYYRSIGYKNIIEIPPIMNLHITEPGETKKRGVLHLTYAGAPAKKDLLKPILQAICEINNHQIFVKFNIIGLSESEVLKIEGVSNLKKYGIFAYGRVPHDNCIKLIRESDFTILLRENKRYAKAGFSTKLAESLSLGVPVICNIVGGADEVIDDGINGLKIPDAQKKTVLGCLRRALDLQVDQIRNMKLEALKTADNLFSMNQYISKLRGFFKNDYIMKC